MDCKFKTNDIVYFTIEGIKAGEKMVASIPKKYFELDCVYVVKQIGEYTDGWHLLVDGSAQFVHEKYFSKAKPEVKIPDKKRTYETITIDGCEYYLIPKDK